MMTKEWWGIGAALLLAACGGGSSADPVELSDADPAAAQRDAEDLSKNALSRQQQETALALIDQICGDTWCDGDYDFRFRLLACSASAHTCTLTLQVFPREGVVARQKSYFRSCKTSGFSGFGSLVTTAPSDYQSLADGYYDALTECISHIEQKLVLSG